MKVITSLFIVMILISSAHAQNTYNVDITFKKTAWDSYPNMYVFGASLAGGDITGDGFSDIIVHSSRYLGDSRYALDIYVYFGSAIMDTLFDAVLRCPGAFGHRISALCIGDVNGDSIGDAIIGDEAGSNGYGEVRIFYGSSPLDTTVDMVLRGEADGGAYGESVAHGDINGDGCEDILVGAYAYNGFTLNGRVYVYYGGALLDTVADIIIDGHNGEAFGKSIGSDGDVNGDGYDDIVVGADENSESFPGAGKVYVFFGGDPMDTIPDCWLHGEGPTHYLGWQPVNIIPNVSNYDNVFFGTSFYPYGFPSYAPGKVYMLSGGSPPDTIVDWFKHGETDSSCLGMCSSPAGFESIDLYGEMLAGAPIGVDRFGKGLLWLGDFPLDSIEDAYLQGNINYSEIGWEVACAGDVNGDGYDEVMFSNYASDSNQTVWVCRYSGNAIAEQNEGYRLPYITIFPNPFSRLINITVGKGYGAKSIETKLYDAIGREVMHNRFGEPVENCSINTECLPAGVYFIEINAGFVMYIGKVVKVK